MLLGCAIFVVKYRWTNMNINNRDQLRDFVTISIRRGSKIPTLPLSWVPMVPVFHLHMCVRFQPNSLVWIFLLRILVPQVHLWSSSSSSTPSTSSRSSCTSSSSSPETHHKSSFQTSWRKSARQRGNTQRPSRRRSSRWLVASTEIISIIIDNYHEYHM